MTATPDAPATEGEPIADEIIAAISDYLDGALAAERRAEVEQKIASDPDWKRAHAELVETRDALSGLQKARAPGSFDRGRDRDDPQALGGPVLRAPHVRRSRAVRRPARDRAR